MTPTQFEELVSEHYKNRGYNIVLTPRSGDYGVDIFASKGKEKLAIQVKMYGNSSRKINRQCIMELHGAKDYFDCTKAIVATDGVILPDAIAVAVKLNIEIFTLGSTSVKKNPVANHHTESFENIWTKYIMPLEGTVLLRDNGGSNTIKKVDWAELERITSNGKPGKIKIEIFKQAVGQLITAGYITRDYINQNYIGRASSGVILVLSQVPFFELSTNPTGLIYQKRLNVIKRQ